MCVYSLSPHCCGELPYGRAWIGHSLELQLAIILLSVYNLGLAREGGYSMRLDKSLAVHSLYWHPNRGKRVIAFYNLLKAWLFFELQGKGHPCYIWQLQGLFLVLVFFPDWLIRFMCISRTRYISRARRFFPGEVKQQKPQGVSGFTLDQKTYQLIEA